MLDKNQLFSDEATITGDGFGTAVAVNKTPADGIDLEVVVHSSTGDTEQLVVTIYEADSTPTAGSQILARFPTFTAAGRQFRRVQSDKKYLSAHYDLTGTDASFVVTAGVVSGKTPDAVA